MTGSMYAAVSGMKNHMNKLNIIGNNVANVNTVGYKAGSVTFQESMYSTYRAGSDGTSVTGGTNPAQIGYGMSISTISLDMSTKQYVPDGNPLHSMISGDGFFMTGPKTSGPINPNDTMLSRVGDFRFDEEGYLVDGRGQMVYGFTSASKTGTGANGDGGGAANYTQNGQTSGVSTQLGPIRLPLAAANGCTLKDADGNTLKEGDPVYSTVDGTGLLTPPPISNTSAKNECAKFDGISIDKNGKITGTSGDQTVVIGYVAVGKVPNPQGVTHVGGAYYQSMGGAGKVSATSMNGAVEGYLNNVDGTVAGAVGSIIETAGKTELATNGLESSGTDVATEFSEMITTQRGYQANTRIITVTDTMLEELVNLKR